MNLIEENPWTYILASIGILIGLVLPSGLDIFSNFDYSQIPKDPVEFLTGYVIAFPIAVCIEIFSGLVFGLIGAVIGISVDNKRNYGDI